ncbi:MAG: YtoQ family protein [Alphaproteobacteria bacterium]
MNDEPLSVYLSGEIHSDWRRRIETGASEAGLEIDWKDNKGARINAIRTRTLIERADLVVVRFGDKYKQWNAAFDAGYAAALGTPLVTLHDADLGHPLKEVDAAALATTETPEQIVRILKYVIDGEL